jgi:hypothetical protein
MFVAVFPDSLVRLFMQRSRWWALALLVPIIVCTSALVLVHVAANQPPTWYGTAGFALMLLAVCKAIFDNTSARPTAAARTRLAELTRARRWLRAELRNTPPRIDPAAAPWLRAIGLDPPPFMLLKEEQEDWGW